MFVNNSIYWNTIGINCLNFCNGGTLWTMSRTIKVPLFYSTNPLQSTTFKTIEKKTQKINIYVFHLSQTHNFMLKRERINLHIYIHHFNKVLFVRSSINLLSDCENIYSPTKNNNTIMACIVMFREINQNWSDMKIN